MDGVHDMGGMDGFGAVMPERDEPVFHADWESRVLAMTRAMGVANGWTIDQQRYAREQIAPHVYLSVSYYQKWFLAMWQMLLDHGVIDADEILVLERGQIIERGRHSQLLELGGHYAAMWNKQREAAAAREKLKEVENDPDVAPGVARAT